jgi:DNA mismatch endonuclease, patch repair protein
MVDNLTPEKRSKIMRAIRSRDTKPEMLVRRLVHSMGYRYRLHSKKLAGQPDLVFASRHSVIFVHGCFWHLHDSCKISHMPEAKGWSTKLLANRLRDQKSVETLHAGGWKVMIIWECELHHLANLRRKIEDFLN